jgi:hypothetical protein
MGDLFFSEKALEVDPPPYSVETRIDEGLSILIGAGVLYGVKELRTKN